MTRTRWAVAGAVVIAGTVAGGVVAISGADHVPPAARTSPANTAAVERGALSSLVSVNGTLTYRARPDGSPHVAINRAAGTYTQLPGEGDRVGCGDVLYRVDDEPVLLLCGRVPAYRGLAQGDSGADVRQLNRNLALRGDDFTSRTATALRRLQRTRGIEETGALDAGDAVFLPGPMRIAKVSARLGAPAATGAPVAHATSRTLEVQVALAASQQGEVREGDRARIILPGNRPAKGTVDRLGRVVRTPDGPDAAAGEATIPAYVRLRDPERARGLDRAPVQVDILTEGVRSALSVPVTALVGRAGGGFAVEAVRDGDRRELVEVELGLFDTTGGRVQVDGDLVEGDRVVVPAS